MYTSFIGRCTFGLQATMPACICKNSHLYLNTVKSWVIIGHILICPESSYIPFIVYVFFRRPNMVNPQNKVAISNITTANDTR